MDFCVDGLNGILWNYVLVYGLLGAGLFFTIRLGALQFLHFGKMLRGITAQSYSIAVALNGAFGIEKLWVGVCVAFTCILGNHSYAENAMVFLGLEGEAATTAPRASCLAMAVWGALQTVTMVFNFDFADAAMGLVAVINLTAILLLSGTVSPLTKDYFRQRQAGQEPTFVLEDFKGPTAGISYNIWNEDAQSA